MENCILISTPMECGLEYTNEPYRELVGSLMFVTLNSRPDLSACVNYFSRFMNCATETHWNHLKRILRYINETLDYTDWANDRNDKRSP